MVRGKGFETLLLLAMAITTSFRIERTLHSLVDLLFNR